MAARPAQSSGRTGHQRLDSVFRCSVRNRCDSSKAVEEPGGRVARVQTVVCGHTQSLIFSIAGNFVGARAVDVVTNRSNVRDDPTFRLGDVAVHRVGSVESSNFRSRPRDWHEDGKWCQFGDGKWAGSPGGIAPPRLPQIRACTLNAPGSSRYGIAVPHTTGSHRGDTLVRHGVLGVVPTPRHNAVPPSLHGVRKAVPPLQHYYGVLRLPDSLLAALRFLRLAIPGNACVSSPFGRRRMADG